MFRFEIFWKEDTVHLEACFIVKGAQIRDLQGTRTGSSGAASKKHDPAAASLTAVGLDGASYRNT